MRSWLMLISIALLGCERGCLSKRLALMQDASLPVNVLDCPDGLARCIDGHLEKSTLGTVSGSGACPWVPVGDCLGECVEGVVIPEEHARQLCRSEGGALAKRSAAGADACHDARFECSASQVIDCEAKQVVAVCTQGCALPALDEDVAEGEAVTILCRH